MSGYTADAAHNQPPAEIEGWDEDGAVSFQISATGDPVGIRVADDWSRRISRSALGPAVMAANDAANRKRSEQFSRDQAEVEWAELRATIRQPAPPVAQPIHDVPPRSLNELAEDAIALSRAARTSGETPSAPLSGTGTAADGALVISVGQSGLISFEVDGDWAALRTGFAISVAAGTALGAARADLERAVREAPTAVKSRRADELFAEAMAQMTALSAPSNDNERKTNVQGHR